MEYVTGDLMECPETFIVHGCNAQGVMGSGVARLIREKWPSAYNKYREAFENGDLGLGTTVWVVVGKKVIINAITQDRYGTDKVHVDYEVGIRESFRTINKVLKDITDDGSPKPRVAMPLIGAGLAGGDWDRISAIIDEEAKFFTPVVYLIDGKVPAGERV